MVSDDTRPWVLDFRATQPAERPYPDITYQPRIAWSPALVSAVSIITTRWNASEIEALELMSYDFRS